MEPEIDLFGDSYLEVKVSGWKTSQYLGMEAWLADYSGIREIVVSGTALCLEYDADFHLSDFRKRLGNIPNDLEVSSRDIPLMEVPICYDDALQNDLPDLEERLDMDREAITESHLKAEYVVEMFGFVPGFPYLGGLPAELKTERRASPRSSVGRGAVAIVGDQCGIYPFDVPGGWNIVGRTPMPMADLKAVDPFRLAQGQKVRFKKISLKEFRSYS